MKSIVSLVTLLVALLAAIAVLIPGIDWGLPSRDADTYLFADRTPWTGAEIIQLTGSPRSAEDEESTAEPLRGADVDASPILDRTEPHRLNETDAQRAEIVRRYRLMSKQPDEFIQFKALAEMSSRAGIEKLDPRLYQYGGLWIYPVGALIRTGMMIGIIDAPTGDAMAFYLDRPDAFGRFYVVARLYSAFWGVVAVGAVWWIVRRLTNEPLTPLLASLVFMTMPVVWTAAQEAKPHLAGLALVLLATIAATQFLERGRLVWALVAGALVGAAAGMVLSMAVAWVMLLTMGVLLKDRSIVGRLRIVGLATLTAGGVFAITNPFLLLNAVLRPELLSSNLGNTAAMYPASLAGVQRGAEILAVGSGWVVFCLGIGGLAVLVGRHLRDRREPAPDYACGCAGPAAPLWLLLPVAAVVFGSFVVFASNKPLEYARFGMLASTVLVIAGLAGVRALFHRRRDWAVLLTVLAAGGSVGLSVYDRVQASEARGVSLTRLEGTRDGLKSRPRAAIGTYFEPAPWSMPPFDLFDRRIILLPTHGPRMDDDFAPVIIYPANVSRDVGMRDDRERLDWKYGLPIVISMW
jgi:hypothetical protein